MRKIMGRPALSLFHRQAITINSGTVSKAKATKKECAMRLKPLILVLALPGAWRLIRKSRKFSRMANPMLR